MKRRGAPLLILFAAASCTAGCGTDYESVADLVKSLRGAGIDCPVFTEAGPPSGGLAHGSCWTPDAKRLFDMHVYGSAKDRDQGITAWSEGASHCMAYGEHWTVSIPGDANGPTCDEVADRLDGQVKQSPADVTP